MSTYLIVEGAGWLLILAVALTLRWAIKRERITDGGR